MSKETSALYAPYIAGAFNLDNVAETSLPYRLAARETEAALSFPTKKDEPWRKTNFSALPIDQLTLAADVETSIGGSPDKVIFVSLKEAEERYPELLEKALGKLVKADADKFSALTAGYAQNGVLCYIPPNVIVDDVLESVIRVHEDGTIQNSQLVVYVGRGASATLLHSYRLGGESKNEALHTGTVEVYLEANAQLKLIETQHLGYETYHFTHEAAYLEADARFEWQYFSLGTKLSKSFIDVRLGGKGSEAYVNGLYVSDDHQHLDIDTQQDHLAPHTTSNLLFKGALFEESRAVWQGMIYVAPGADATDGYQTSNNLILDDRAHVDAIPGLEIKTDDVRCSHGATISQVDETAMFYLRSRGLGEAEARHLIVSGYFNEVIEKIPVETLRTEIESYVSEKVGVLESA